MTKAMKITEARKSLMEIPSLLEGASAPEAIEVTRRGVPVFYLVSPEEYMVLAETREVVADRATLKGIARGLEDAEKGRLHSAGKVREKLGL